MHIVQSVLELCQKEVTVTTLSNVAIGVYQYPKRLGMEGVQDASQLHNVFTSGIMDAETRFFISSKVMTTFTYSGQLEQSVYSINLSQVLSISISDFTNHGSLVMVQPTDWVAISI